MAPAFAPDLTLRSHQEVHDAFRNRHLRQALYDAGAAVMADSLIVLHGTEHRDRRRVENRLFRRQVFVQWEDEMVDAAVERAFRPFIDRGVGDLVTMAHRTTMNLTAYVAGIDQPAGTIEETERLLAITRTFSEGATMVHTTRDPAVLEAEVLDVMERFDDEFLQPSIARRAAALASGADDAPTDVLATLLAHREELGLSDDVIRREVAFYLQAGSHSTANAFTHTVHDLFGWAAQHPEDLEAARTDRSLAKRAFHESLRLRPASPVAWRRAVEATTLRTGAVVAEGALLELDLVSANTDPAVWGSDGGVYNLHREPPAGVPPWGHSFGGGRHLCIGMELDGGTAPDDDSGQRELFGTVSVMVSHLLEAGAAPDPEHPPTQDPTSQRVQFGVYPVVFR